MSEHIIHLIGGEDDETAIAICTARAGQCCIAFRFRGRVLEEDASDYFEALCRVRLRLEEEKLIPFCYGASLNVYPSGMARDMGAGMKAYRLTIGRQAKDLVGTFDEGADVIPATVARQREYFDEWLASKKA
jgi:hypothetical protein